MFDDIDYFLSFGDETFCTEARLFMRDIFFDTKINVQLDSK